MWPVFDQAVEKFQTLEQQLGDPAVIANREQFAKVAKEHGSLSKLVGPYLEYKGILDQIEQAEAMRSDPEMRDLAEEELDELKPKRDQYRLRLEDLILIDPGEDFGSVIVEIRAGTGGDEAAIFAGDLYEMYMQYARDKGWRVEGISFGEGEQGGYKEVVFSVKGDEVFQHLRYESGGHRVQRVPKTEQQGRIHTSAATVAVLPEPDEVEVEINPDDLIEETMRAGGAGGQHVNKTESAIRLWYKKGTPDEIEVKCQDERSQHKNRATAMRRLRSLVYERQIARQQEERAAARKDMIGSGDRSQRIRTYNYPQNRVTDHRINLTIHKLDAIVAGDLHELIQGLREYDKQQRLAESGA
ncbi:MAG: peptide chain release factor 1 [Gemmataceae bacterium]